jgi:ABC-2 type transport system permease protein
MSIFYRSVSVELRKILIRKKYYVFLLIELLLTAGVVLFTSANGFQALGFSLDLPNLPYAILNFLTVFVLPLTIFMLCADVFTNEIETGMLKAVLLRPINRFCIFASKMTAVTLYAFLHLLTVCAVVLGIKILLRSQTDFILLPAAYLISVYPMIAFVAFASLISLLVGNSSLAMFGSMLLYFLMQGITLVSAPVGAIFFTSHLGFYRMTLTTHPTASLLNTLILLTSYIVLLSVGAYWLFDKKEL